jgi:hypothetical protein
LWQVLQETPLKATCTACAPATFGYVPPAGGLAWHEVQLSAVSGEAATWHVWQTGPTFVDGEETS